MVAMLAASLGVRLAATRVAAMVVEWVVVMAVLRVACRMSGFQFSDNSAVMLAE